MTPSVCVYRDMWARLGRLSALHVQQAHMLMIITHLRASSVHPTPHTHRRGRMISMHASATPGFQVPTAVHVCPVLRGASREGVGVRAVWCARSTPSPPKQAKSVLRAQATLLRPKRVSVSTNAYVTPGSDTWGRGVRLVCLVPPKFKTTSANEACVSCGDGLYQNEYDGTVCLECAANAVSLTQRDKCLCQEGYIQASVEDINPTCTACEAGQYQHVLGQTACANCMDFSSSPAASPAISYCLCEAGYYENDDDLANLQCVQCAAGTYKGAATDNDEDLAECSTCPLNTHSPEGSEVLTACICNVGHAGNDGEPCVACVPGQFKASNGSGTCEACVFNFYSETTAATECDSCVELLNSDGAITEAEGSDSAQACVCSLALGYIEVEQNGASTCSGCQAGTFATGGGCQNCTGGRFADVAGLTACRDCPANSSSYDYPHVACQCHAGYICAPDGKNQSEACPSGNCIACPIDTFKDYTGGATACDVCQNNSVSDLASVSQDDCKCDLGYRQDGPDTCVACLAGHYADTLDLVNCKACGDRFYTEHSDFPWTSEVECRQCQVCSAQDHYDAANNGAGCGFGAPSECLACPSDTSLFQPSTVDNWNAGVHSCKCDADLYGPSGGPCDGCPTNSIRNFSDSNSSISDCVCDAGFEPHPALAHECRACPVNTYKTGPGNYNCTACPDTLVTYAERNVHEDACVCAPGLIYVNNQCKACAANSYKGGYNRHSACDECRPHSVSASGARESQACQCNSGYELYLDEALVEENRLYMSVDPNALLTNWEGSGCRNTPTAGYPWSFRFDHNDWNTVSLELPCAWIRQWYEHQYMWNFDVMPDWGDKTDLTPDWSDIPDNRYTKSEICQEISPFQAAIPGQYSVPDSPASMACPANTQWWRCEQWRSFQLPVGSDWRQMTIDSYETIHLVYDYCDCCRWHQGNFRIVNIDQGEYVYSQMLGNHPNTSCQACDVGKFKNFTSNVECELCAINTYTANVGSFGCSTCETGKSTAGLLGQSYCECDAGTERESSDVLSACQTCVTGKFKSAPSYEQPNCTLCGVCEPNFQVASVCISTQDITCAPCQLNSWFPTERTELGTCYCNAGYELKEDQCEACVIGKSRHNNMNNSIICETCAAGKFADTVATEYCDICSPFCNSTIIFDGIVHKTFVAAECDSTQDITCKRCDPCPAGQYANNSCGLDFNNDRSNTQCVICPAGFYCPGGLEGAGEDVKPIQCTNNALSPPGSDDVSDCECHPGYFNDGEGCTPCPYDTYCPGQNKVIPCPFPGRTFHMASTVRLDCHCPRTYYRNPIGDLLNFNCSICTPNDYCFNNSLFNCTDPLMESEAGSGYFKNCTCIDRFFNDGEVCVECAVDHFCIDGQEHDCPTKEWTNSLPRQLECVCQVGYYRINGVCEMCPENFYCDGTDDSKIACPEHSVANNYTGSLSECKCLAGYEAVFTGNASEPHTCVRCIDDLGASSNTYKHTIGNTPCLPCLLCNPAESTFTNVVCNATGNAHCDACTVCYRPSEGSLNYRTHECAELSDTVCANCTNCDFAVQWESQPCQEVSDTHCLSISFDRLCEVGQYVLTRESMAR